MSRASVIDAFIDGGMRPLSPESREALLGQQEALRARRMRLTEALRQPFGGLQGAARAREIVALLREREAAEASLLTLVQALLRHDYTADRP